MTTALAIIESAMGKIGLIEASETPSGDDTALCLKRLNSLIDSLGGDDVFAYTTVETVATLPAATTQLAIGTGLAINVARPVKLLRQCFTRLAGIDRELMPISEADFNRISIKSLASLVPIYCTYGGELSPGTVQFYPPSQSAVELHIFTPTQIAEPANITIDLVLPPGYRRYLEYALAVEIAPDYGKTPTPLLLATAANAKRALRKMNSKVPQLKLDAMRGWPITIDMV